MPADNQTPLERRMRWALEEIYRGINDCDIPWENFRYWTALQIEGITPEIVQEVVARSPWANGASRYAKETLEKKWEAKHGR